MYGHLILFFNIMENQLTKLDKAIKIGSFFLVVMVAVFLLSGCSNKASLKKTTWQGTYYPEGCLTCEKDYVYSPIFDNFKDCKTWVLNKKSSSKDRVTCNKNCKNPDEYGMQNCEEVIRNWEAFPGASVTFENYNE